MKENNSATTAIDAQMAKWSPDLDPLRRAVDRYLVYPSAVDGAGVGLVGHRPWVAPKNYLFRLYPPVAQEEHDRYCRAVGLAVPEIYDNILRQLNGAFCFSMSLFGLAGSAPDGQTDVPCHNLSLAVTRWIREFRIPPGLFYFGTRPINFSDMVGYFVNGDQRILCIMKDGKVLEGWDSFAQFLEEELQASEALEEEINPSKWRN